MEWLLNFLQGLVRMDGVVASIITGIFTFVVTKYTYHKNIPLDKYEKAYNRVYYPIYCLIRSDKNRLEVIEKSEFYFVKYEKYVDRSTLKAFRYLKETNGEKAYQNFKNNIYAMDTKLRIRLGYLESNIFTMYTYSSPSDKRMIRVVLEIMGIYIPAIFSTYLSKEEYIYGCVCISVFFMLILVGEGTVAVVPIIFRWVVTVFSSIIRNVNKLLWKKKR